MKILKIKNQDDFNNIVSPHGTILVWPQVESDQTVTLYCKTETGEVTRISTSADDGNVPSIGENGNWFIGENDTGIAATGPAGDIGPAGPNGETGATGPQGIQGATGIKGETGPIGPQGIQGATGAKGDKGETGDKGDKGDDGGKTPVPFTAANVTGNIAVLAGEYPVVMIRTNTSQLYNLEDGDISWSNGNTRIDLSRYLMYENIASFSGTWTAYYAAGRDGAEMSGALIMPGSADEYETIYVGPTRAFTSLTAALAYMKTKNSGSKGFDILLDSGTYTAVTFTLMNVRVRSFDENNFVIIEGNLLFEYCTRARVTNLNINGSLRFFDGTNGYVHGVHINSSISHGLMVYRNSYCTIVHSSISRSELNTSSMGVVLLHNSFVSISDVSISNFSTGIYAVASCSVMVESGLPQSVIDGCTRGILASGMTYVEAVTSYLAITNTTTVSSPPINTVGNYNSYITRI